MTEKPTDRPRYQFSADRHSAKRRVRYVESNHPGSGNCTLCELDEHGQCELPEPPASSEQRPEEDQ